MSDRARSRRPVWAPLIPAETWRDRAACSGEDTNSFFDGDLTEALALCKTCPVANECLAEAMTIGKSERYGVWGGQVFGRPKYGATQRDYQRRRYQTDPAVRQRRLDAAKARYRRISA